MEKSKLLQILEESSETEMTLIQNYFIDKLLKDLDNPESSVLSYVKRLQDEVYLLKEQINVLSFRLEDILRPTNTNPNYRIYTTSGGSMMISGSADPVNIYNDNKKFPLG